MLHCLFTGSKFSASCCSSRFGEGRQAVLGHRRRRRPPLVGGARRDRRQPRERPVAAERVLALAGRLGAAAAAAATAAVQQHRQPAHQHGVPAATQPHKPAPAAGQHVLVLFAAAGPCLVTADALFSTTSSRDPPVLCIKSECPPRCAS